MFRRAGAVLAASGAAAHGRRVQACSRTITERISGGKRLVQRVSRLMTVSTADFHARHRREISFKYLANLVRTEESISR